MYKIEIKDYGYHLMFKGLIKEDEMDMWYKESIENLKSAPDKFGIFADLRNLIPLPPESQSKMEKGQKKYKEKGMVRSVVILNNPVTTMQFKRLARKTGIYEWERYIDASSNENWESQGVNWIQNAIDPD